MLEIIEEMVREAAKEVNVEYNRMHVQEVLNNVELNYGIEIDEDDPARWQVMKIVTDEISEWQDQYRWEKNREKLLVFIFARKNMHKYCINIPLFIYIFFQLSYNNNREINKNTLNSTTKEREKWILQKTFQSLP